MCIFCHLINAAKMIDYRHQRFTWTSRDIHDRRPWPTIQQCRSTQSGKGGQQDAEAGSPVFFRKSKKHQEEITFSAISRTEKPWREKRVEKITKRKKNWGFVILTLFIQRTVWSCTNWMASLYLDGIKKRNSIWKSARWLIWVVSKMIFACKQSGLTKPPLVHRLAVCAAHLV